MTDLDPYQSVEGRYIKIIALLPENDLPVEERNNLHLCITQEDLMSLIEKKFTSKVVEESIIEHEYGNDGYCRSISFIKLKKYFRNLIAAGINETNIRSARK